MREGDGFIGPALALRGRVWGTPNPPWTRRRQKGKKNQSNLESRQRNDSPNRKEKGGRGPWHIGDLWNSGGKASGNG